MVKPCHNHANIFIVNLYEILVCATECEIFYVLPLEKSVYHFRIVCLYYHQTRFIRGESLPIKLPLLFKYTHKSVLLRTWVGNKLAKRQCHAHL